MSELSEKLEEGETDVKEEGEEDDSSDGIPNAFESPESPEVSCSNKEADIETNVEVKDENDSSDEAENEVKEFENSANESTKTDGKTFDVELDFEGEQVSDQEDGEIPGEKPVKEEKVESEEGEDGELSEDGELEEGELEEAGPASKTPTRQVCRFFNRGKCTFGQVCRFLHLNNNYGRGNYNMFQSNDRYSNNNNSSWQAPANDPAIANPRSAPRQDYFVPPFVPPPIPQPSPLESAWERGLQNAKKLVKKAHIRKGSSPDFEEKRLNLSLSQDLPENDKENDKKKGDRQNFYKYEAEPTNWKRHSFDNFEIRYTNRDFIDVPYREREKGSPPMNRRDNYPDRGDKMPKRGGRQWDNERFGALPRLRAEEWYDPYRRSKSPKGRRSRSRSGSYSTVSSYSYSERSSVSYSRSSSGSCSDSSRSPSPLSRRNKSPTDGIMSPKRGDSRLMPRRKPGGRHGRSGGYSRSLSSRSRSRSRSSSSRSLSMDSISESGNSSPASLGGSKPIMSRKVLPDEEKLEEQRPKKIFQHLQYLKDQKEQDMSRDEGLEDPLIEMLPSSAPAFPSLQHLLPSSDKKEPNKQKQQIKLTLLNKTQPNKFSSLQKDVEPTKSKPLNEPKFGGFHTGTKRPLSPPSPVMPAKSAPAAAAPKKSASSRREELLKQLKAVEDAIARKRAKFS